MKKQVIFRGVGTALITPFSNGEVDFNALDRIVNSQLEGGADALIVLGTTGEAATLSDSERCKVFEHVKKAADGRTKLIFGTGSNDTREAVRRAREAEKIGCDGLLVVTPYYNKGTSRGITEHFERIADSTSLPIILYNVPSRTGVNLSLSEIERLIKRESIVAIKEACDSVDRLTALSGYGDELGIYAGSDSAFYTVLSLGGLGVISVASNAALGLMKRIYQYFCDGDIIASRRLSIGALPFFDSLFCETNPAPIKYLMHKLGYSKNELRLPLFPIEEKGKEIIEREIKAELISEYLAK